MNQAQRVAATFLFVLVAASAARAEDVVWTSTAGVSVTGNSLAKTGTVGWNAGGISTKQLPWGPAYMEVVASETTTYRVVGLSKGNTDQSLGDVDFGFYLQPGVVGVFQNGAQAAVLGPYTAGDVFRVEAEPGQVRYRKNGVVVYTSNAIPRFPLLVDAALYDNGATLNTVTMGTSVFSRAANVSVLGGTLTKTGTAGWNGGAVSVARFEMGDGYAEATAVETNTNRAFGLGTGDGSTTVDDIEFALQLLADGTYAVVESGTSRGNFGAYAASDVFRVEVSGGTVRYKRNGTTVYTSAVAPAYPLSLDTALDTVGGTLANVQLVGLMCINAANVGVSGTTVTKTSAAGWNGGLNSTTSLGGDGWFEFSAQETNTDRVAGLGNGNTDWSDADVDFGIFLKSDGTLAVLESGVSRGAFGAYAVGDRFRVEVGNGVVVYRKNGLVFYTSAVAPTFPLAVDTSLNQVGATLANLAMGSLVWKSDIGVVVNGSSLQKTAGAGWGNAGASSTASLASGNGALELTVGETSSSSVIGLSNGDADDNWSEIDYGVSLSTGALGVYENGVSRGSFGAYATGDRLRVQVLGGVVRYYRNDVLFYTSAVAPTYPLLVDTSQNTTDGALVDVFLRTGGNAIVDTPTFAPAAGTYTSAQTVTVSCATSGATIRYTTNGNDPTITDPTIASGGTIAVSTSQTLKARAWKAGSDPSGIRAATYTMNFGTLAAPVISPATGTYTTATSATITATAGTTIRYTTDGSDPTAASPAYTGALPITVTTTLKAKAFHPDYTMSATATATYTIVVAAPVISPGSGAYAPGAAVTVSCADPGAVLRYTLNGVDPTTSDPTMASGGTLVAGNYTLKVKAWRTGASVSATTTAAYTLTGPFTTATLAIGNSHVAALKTDGTVWTWGSVSAPPISVPGLTGVTRVASGTDFSVALRSDGTVWTWGTQGCGVLGNGVVSNITLTVPVNTGLTGVAGVAAGQRHSLAVKSDGTVWAWGCNAEGELGDNSVITRSVPVLVTGLSGAVEVTAGASHSVARLADGTVRAWGQNVSAQVGDGFTVNRLVPTVVDGLTSIVGLAAGANHTLALRDDGAVWAWGDNGSNQIGDGSGLMRYTPSRALIDGAIAIGAGLSRSFAIRSGGEVWAWGGRQSGGLGDGTSSGTQVVPTALSGVTGVSRVAGGVYDNGGAVTSDGRAFLWGSNAYSAVGDGSFVNRTVPTEISGPGFDWKVGTPRLSIAGVYYGNGQPATYAANQSLTISETTPGATLYYTTNGVDPTQSDTTIASGGTVTLDHSMTVKARAWKTGMPASNVESVQVILKPARPSFSPGAGNYTTPQNVTISCATAGAVIRYTTDGSDPTAASTQYTAPVAVASGFTLRAKAFKATWTDSDTETGLYTLNLATLAAPTFSPAAGAYVDSVTVTISALAGASIRYTTNGNTPTAASALYTAPLTLTAGTTVKAIAVRADYTDSAMATAVYGIQLPTPQLSPAGGTYAYGQLVTVSSTVPGVTLRYSVDSIDPTANEAQIPTGTSLRPLSTTTLKLRAFKAGFVDSAVAAATYTITGTPPNPGDIFASGDKGFLRVQADGSLRGWGGNSYGELGDASYTNRSSPIPLTGFGTVAQMAGGQTYALARRTDGAVYGTGANNYGQIGATLNVGRNVPAALAGLSGILAVAAGEAHGLAVKPDGTVWAWGDNSVGQLGNTTPAQSTTPIAVQGLTGAFTAVAAGSYHSLALRSDGTVWGWGTNSSGQLGDTTTTSPRRSAVQVSGLTGSTVVAIAAGGLHSLALLSDGTVREWGSVTTGPVATSATVVSGLGGVTSIAAGWNHSAAARRDGSAVTWGYGIPALGLPPVGYSTYPVLPLGPTGVVQVAAGYGHTVALTDDGTVWAWGTSGNAVGNGDTVSHPTPIRILDPGLLAKAAGPTFSVATGTYYAEQLVTAACTTAGATIRYTTNGADPGAADAVFPAGGLTIDQSMTVRARAFKSGLQPSDPSSATYTMALAPLAMTPGTNTYATDQNMALTNAVSGTTIRYTTDGSVPTGASPAYSAPLSISQTTTVNAQAWRTGWTTSISTAATYTMKVASATVTPAAGAYATAQTVTVSTVTPGATLHYTLNGAPPTESDPVVAIGGTVLVDKSSTLAVRGFRSGWTTGDTQWFSYAIAAPALATPVIVPAAGTYTAAQMVRISSATPGAILRYTTDGSDPGFQSPLYTRPLTVDGTMTVKARAFLPETTPSAIATSAFTINLTNTVAPVTFSPPPSTYTTARSVTLATATAGATIYYTTTGVDPTTSDPSVASGGTVLIDRSSRLKAIAVKAGMTTSPLRFGDYPITGAATTSLQTVLLKTDGTVWGFGDNSYGQLGNNSTTAATTPVQAQGLTNVVAISSGAETWPHTIAAKADGTVWTWGFNNYGVLGDGTTTPRYIPTQVPGLTGVIAVLIKETHSVALKADGTVWSWGYGVNGQLGNGLATSSLTPVQATGLTDVISIAAGLRYTIALKRDGTVWAIGYNAYGMLGNGTNVTSNVPIQVPGLSGVAAIAANGSSVFALKTDGALTGSLWAWGADSTGLFGVGGVPDQWKPIRVRSNVVGMACGESSSLVLTQDANARRTLWGSGNHAGVAFGGPLFVSSVPTVLTNGDFIGLPWSQGAGMNRHTALRWDMRPLAWDTNGINTALESFLLGSPGIALDDPDADGLTTGQEWSLGTDPFSADTNLDGIPDGAAIGSGMSATSPDVDGDGVANDVERARGTDPFRTDSDNDGVADGTDCYPTDSTRSTCPTPDPNDHTPPTITLTEPTNAVLIP
jgi:alpha-tubulin suppressor-like RCC1 family protein